MSRKSATYTTTLEKGESPDFERVLAALPADMTAAVQAMEDPSIEIELSGTYSPGSEDYYDSTLGAYLPGDPPEAELTHAIASITVDGTVRTVNVSQTFSRSDFDRLCTEARENDLLVIEEADEPDYDLMRKYGG